MRIIQSPVPLWPGTITLPNWLNFEQDRAWRDALATITAERKEIKIFEAVLDPILREAYIPAFEKIVVSWDLGNGFPCPPTLETFPATPIDAVGTLMVMLIVAIENLYSDASDLPLASPPPPIVT